ncbi:MAG TPA: T9SS type A sorting domain-containing protein [Cytophagales bacterium]|nr:T9SS type A sorting domain-containing protein [Cytophagales bacterium]
MKRRLTSRTSVKTKTSIKKYVVAGLTLSIFIALGCYLVFNFGNSENAKAAPEASKSQVEKRGDWEKGNSWLSGFVPGTADDYLIDGTVRRNGNLELGPNQSLTINSGDTLIITGNLTLSNTSDLVVMDNATLIVWEDYYSGQQSSDKITGGGTLIILGKISFSNGNNSNLEIGEGANIYYDQTLNSDIVGKITGTGNQYDISQIPNSFETFTSDGTMPVKLLAFSADLLNDKINLNWEMEDELEVDRYEIQKSTDGIDFEKIGEVEAMDAGNYSFTDNQAKSGRLFYRVAMVKFDQSTIFSPITHLVYSSNSTGIKLFPNICKGDEINFQGDDLQHKTVRVMVYDLNGKIVLSDNIMTNSDDTYKISFDKKLNRGNYFVHFAYDNQVLKEKFIVSY